MLATTTSNAVKSAPKWLPAAQVLCQSLPFGRYSLLHRLGSGTHEPFWCRAARRVGEFEFLCHLQDSIAREVCFTGIYEPQETLLVQRILRPGATFVDVGANWGYFSLLASHLVGDTGKVISFEPDPRIVSLMRSNLTRNRLSQVSVVAAAASVSAGEMPWVAFDAADGNWGTSRMGSSAAADSTATVETVVLDDVLDALGVAHVDLLKMDIEGGEAFALQGMQQGLSQGRYRRILLELHPSLIEKHGTTAERLLELLTSQKYDCWRIDHSGDATRRVAYGHCRNAQDLLQKRQPEERLDSWPHLLCVPQGEAPLFTLSGR